MTGVKYEELWEPWYIGEPPYASARMDTWKDIPEPLIERFKAAKEEMEAVWSELKEFNPDYDA